MIDIKKFFKGLKILNSTDPTKELSFEVSDSSTTDTTTTIVSSSTADRTITLPDSSGTLVVTSGALTPNRAVITNGSGGLDVSTTTSTEIGYVSGVTSSIQDQLDDKANTTLSNLTSPTAVNQDVIPSGDRDLGNSTDGWTEVYAGIYRPLGNQSVVGDVTNGSAVITNVIGDTSKLNPYFVEASGYFPKGTEVASTTVNTITMTLPATTPGTGVSITFVGSMNPRTINQTGAVTSGFAQIRSGNAQNGESGSLLLRTGTVSGTGDSGTIFITSGNTNSGDSGNIDLTTGTTVSGTRGSVNITASQVDVNGSKIVDVANPTNPQDVATKNYVDTFAGNGANTSLSNLTNPTSINQGLIPNIDGSRPIGDATNRWSSLYTWYIQHNDSLTPFIDMVDGELVGSSNINSIEWGSRRLINSAGNIVLVYSGTDLDINNRKIVNVNNPTNPQDVATKDYVDNSGGGGSANFQSGSRGSPNAITAGGGITATDNRIQTIYVTGSGGPVTITAVPAISKTDAVAGDIAYIVARSDTNTVTINNQSGDVELNGTIVLGESDILSVLFDGTAWVEMSRNN